MAAKDKVRAKIKQLREREAQLLAALEAASATEEPLPGPNPAADALMEKLRVVQLAASDLEVWLGDD